MTPSRACRKLTGRSVYAATFIRENRAQAGSLFMYGAAQAGSLFMYGAAQAGSLFMHGAAQAGSLFMHGAARRRGSARLPHVVGSCGTPASVLVVTSTEGDS